MSDPVHSTPSALRALFQPILFGVCISLGGLFLCRALVPIDVLRQSDGVVGNYLQTLGTIYAVLLAFVVFVVWSQFNDARLRVEAEANELLDLSRTARGFNGHTCDRLHGHLREYLRVVLGPEWIAMGRSDATGFDDGWLAMEKLWDHLVRLEPRNDREQAIYSEVLARFNDLSDARTERLSSACLRIPMALKFLLYFGAATTIGSMYLFAVENPVIHALLVAALSGSISHVLYLVSDLDDCFRGDWQVPRAPFERVTRYLDSHPGDAGVAPPEPAAVRGAVAGG